MKLQRVPIPVLAMVGLLVAFGACDGGGYDQTGQQQEEAATPAPYETEQETAAMDEREGEPAYGEDMDETAEQKAEAEELVKEAADVVTQMTNDPDLENLMKQAKGVFIVPDYGKGAVGVGARAGEGVLVARDGGDWSAPAFYDIGAVSVGAQLGGTGGEIAMLLMTDDGIEKFKSESNFSLNADADLTLVDYSARAQASAGKGEDVVFWSDTEGAFAGVSLGVTGITWDDEENLAFYGEQASAEDVLSGKVTGPQAKVLKRQLPA